MKDSFAPGIETVGPEDQLAHPDHLAHSERLVRKLYQVREGAWSLVGNGLSNQSFIEGPEGLIVIDTGDCREEMAAAMAEIRTRTDAPVVACIYTHFHYVGGTEVLLEASGNPDLPIWGHAGIEANLKRFGGEIGPRVSRGLVHQFGMAMPAQGPDGLVNVGLGNFYRNPDHAPFTRAYVPANNTFEAATKARIAGLDVHFLPAPSDATDSATVWFPELGIAVNNLLWPALFNVFAIRGEEYRDPRILINGLDELLGLDAKHLIAAHGPPMAGGAEIRERVQNYRDAIQFLWDQTVRHANLGYGLDEMIAHITLPEAFSAHFTTRQFYGLVEHHVRQIYTGLFGWFDENEANLFPVPLPERAARMIEGFGGIETVRAHADAAIDAKDYRWAIELASWLVRSEENSRGRADAGAPEDRARLASALRGVARSSTSANVRNWCITRALELDALVDIERLRGHRIRKADVMGRPLRETLAILRVRLVPAAAADVADELTVRLADGTFAGLAVRNCVAVPTHGSDDGVQLNTDLATLGDLLAGKLSLADAIAAEDCSTNDAARLAAFMACFDIAPQQGRRQQ